MGLVINATPRPLYRRGRPCTPSLGGWVGPRAGLDGWGKSRPQQGFDPQTVASRRLSCPRPKTNKIYVSTVFHSSSSSRVRDHPEGHFKVSVGTAQ